MGSPVSPVICNLFMEDLEERVISTAPNEMKPRIWKRYVDDIFEIIPRGMSVDLTNHLNSCDPTESIKFTYEEEQDGSLPFLDVKITRQQPSGRLQFAVYRKPTHTDHYLQFSSHHPLHQKLGVARTLFDRSHKLVTDLSDRTVEEKHVVDSLKSCGYPDWTFEKVRRNRLLQERESRQEEITDRVGVAVIPYVKGLSEAIKRTFAKYDIKTAMKPVCTLKQQLVHPKDQRTLEERSGLVYRIPCESCDCVYVGETARNFKYRLKEHKKDVDTASANRVFTRAAKKTSEAEFHKSAITDHVMRKNHVINWTDSISLDSEPNDYSRRIKEAIRIKQQPNSMNRDEGAYKLSRLYNPVLLPVTPSGRTRKH